MTVRLEELSVPKRRLVDALLKQGKAKAAAERQKPAAAEEVRRASGERPSAA